MNLSLTCALYLPGTVGKDEGEEQVKYTYFFYLDCSYSSEDTRESLKLGWSGVVPRCLAPAVQQKYVSESSSAGCRRGMDGGGRRSSVSLSCLRNFHFAAAKAIDIAAGAFS